jgi:hypothetical protein
MSDKKCPDCGDELEKIILFGRGWENPISKVAVDAELSFFAEGDAERNGFSAKFTPAGEVESYLCSGCGKIFLYGKTKAG